MKKIYCILIFYTMSFCHILSAADVEDKWLELRADLTSYIQLNIKLSNHLTTLQLPNTIEEKVLLRVTFKDNINIKEKEWFCKLLKKKTTKFFLNRVKGFKKPIEIVEYVVVDYNDPCLLNEIVKFSMYLFQCSGLSFEEWNRHTAAPNNQDRCVKLQKAFADIVFAYDPTVPTLSFKDCKNIPEFKTRLDEFEFLIENKSLLLVKELENIEALLFKRIAKQVKRPTEKSEEWTRFILELMVFISSSTDQETWSRAHNVLSSAQDALEAISRVLEKVRVLKTESNRFGAIIDLKVKLTSQIAPKFRAALVAQSMESNSDHTSDDIKNKQRIEKMVSCIHSSSALVKNIGQLITLCTIVDQHLKENSLNIKTSNVETKKVQKFVYQATPEKSEPVSSLSLEESEPNNLFCGESPSASVTAECKREARNQLANQDRRRQVKEEKKIRNDAEDQVNSDIKSEATDIKSSENGQIFNIKIQGNCTEQQVTGQSLVPKAHIFLSTDVIENCIIDEKMKVFLETAERMKILTQNSLGKNGIKIYGLDLLIAKNKKFSAEHLLFIAHPINNGEQGYLFMPYKIVNHNEYEQLLNDHVTLENLVATARKSMTIGITG